jgi:hypothetical protein
MLCGLSLDKFHLTLLLFAVCVLMLSIGNSISISALSTDDYLLINRPLSGAEIWNQNLIQGRWGGEVLLQMTRFLGTDTTAEAQTIYGFLSLLLFAVSAVWIVMIYGLNPLDTGTLIFVAIFLSFPYQAEMFLFHSASLHFATSMFFGTAGLIVLNDKRWINRVVGGALIFISLSLYQIALCYILAIIACGYVIQKISPVRQHISWGPMVTITIATAMVYFVVYKLATLLAGIGEGEQYSPVIGIYDIIPRVEHIFNVFSSIFMDYQPLFFPKNLQILAMLAIISGIISVGIRGRNRIFCILLLCAAPFFAVSTLLVLKYMPGTLFPRLYGAEAVVIASSALISLMLWKQTKPLSVLFVMMGIVLAFGFIVSCNHIFYEQQRTNHSDAITAARLIGRLTENPSIRTAVAVVKSSLPEAQGNQSASVLKVPWGAVTLIEQYSHLKLSLPTSQDRLLAQKHCDERTVVPPFDDIQASGDLLIICLDR